MKKEGLNDMRNGRQRNDRNSDGANGKAEIREYKGDNGKQERCKIKTINDIRYAFGCCGTGYESDLDSTRIDPMDDSVIESKRQGDL